ncbi:MAG: XdhC family protein [Phycisphaerae bacterium]|nr:XdhC family protein [Phycisphaerae bacterium]
MNELVPILAALVADVEAGRPAALCTIVKTTGSTPREPGAAMLVQSDGTTLGTVGGGPVEIQVQKEAGELLKQNRAVRFNTALDHDATDGMICGGQMQIAVTPVSSAAQLEPFREALAAARRREPAQLSLVVEHESKRLEYRLHLEVPPTLVIAGAGHVGQAVAKLAGLLDFHVVVIDDRADMLTRRRFDTGVEFIVGDVAQSLRDYPLDAGCYVVIVTRGHKSDQQALAAVLRRPAAYIGMMGSRRKVDAILSALTQAGVPPDVLARAHTPIGVSIGAKTVPELAVSILAEVIQVRRKTTPKLVEGPFEILT